MPLAKTPRPEIPKKVELLSKVFSSIPTATKKAKRETFKDSVIGLFDDALVSDDFTKEDKRTIARLRAKVQIEF